MGRVQRFLLAWMLIPAFLILAPTAIHAGPIFHPHRTDCPKPSYSPAHYWTPSLFRINACIHGPRVDLYAPDRVPGIPPRYQIQPFPCPATDPATIYQGRETLP